MSYLETDSSSQALGAPSSTTQRSLRVASKEVALSVFQILQIVCSDLGLQALFATSDYPSQTIFQSSKLKLCFALKEKQFLRAVQSVQLSMEKLFLNPVQLVNLMKARVWLVQVSRCSSFSLLTI